MLQHTHSQRLHPPQDQPALERRQDGTGAFLKKSQFLRLLGLGADHDPSQSVAVSVEELGGGVDDHVGAEPDRTLKKRRHESVIDNHLNTTRMAEFADGAKVAKLHQRIGGRLQKYETSVLLQCALDVVDIGGIDIGKRQTKVSQHLIEQARRPSVQIVSCDNRKSTRL